MLMRMIHERKRTWDGEEMGNWLEQSSWFSERAWSVLHNSSIVSGQRIVGANVSRWEFVGVLFCFLIERGSKVTSWRGVEEVLDVWQEKGKYQSFPGQRKRKWTKKISQSTIKSSPKVVTMNLKWDQSLWLCGFLLEHSAKRIVWVWEKMDTMRWGRSLLQNFWENFPLVWVGVDPDCVGTAAFIVWEK